MNRKCLLLLAVFLYFSLCVQSVSFSQIENYSRKIQPHTGNWDAFNKQGYINFEKGERQKRDSAKKQAQLEFLRESLKLAQEHMTGKQDTSSEIAESVDIKDETVSVSELDMIRQGIADKAELLSTKLNTLNKSYLAAITKWEGDYLISRTNALHNDYVNVIVHFEFDVRRYDYNPFRRNRRTHSYDLNENFNGVDNRWYLIAPGAIKFHRWRGDRDPGWNGVKSSPRSYYAHFWQDAPRADDSSSGHGSSKIDVTFTLKLTDQAIKDRVNYEIGECHKAVQQ